MLVGEPFLFGHLFFLGLFEKSLGYALTGQEKKQTCRVPVIRNPQDAHSRPQFIAVSRIDGRTASDFSQWFFNCLHIVQYILHVSDMVSI